MMTTRQRILATTLICVFVTASSAPVNHLDVFIARRELKRFFPDFEIGDFYLIRKGVIDNFVQNQATGYLPAIVPSTYTLELRLQSKQKLYYKLYLSSSDRSLMRTPTANIKLSGQVPRKAKPFRIRFPCSGRKTGQALLIVRMEFMIPSRKKTVATKFTLKLKRKCEKVKDVLAKPVAHKPNFICDKKCNKEQVMTRFCISDFAIRARVEKRFLGKDGRIKYRIRVTKRYKTSRMAIAKRHIIELRGHDITCNCTPLQLHKIYLMLGKENKRTNTLFLDDYTYAIDWENGGKKLAKLHKKKDKCPTRFFNVWHAQ